jgi:hypothetical protein
MNNVSIIAKTKYSPDTMNIYFIRERGKNRIDYQEYHDVYWSYTRFLTFIVYFPSSTMSNDKKRA